MPDHTRVITTLISWLHTWCPMILHLLHKPMSPSEDAVTPPLADNQQYCKLRARRTHQQVSSTLSHFFSMTTPHRRPTMPPAKPINSAPPTLTLPTSWVTATKPAMQTEQAPNSEGLPRVILSANIQERMAPEITITVFKNANAVGRAGRASIKAEPSDIQDRGTGKYHW